VSSREGAGVFSIVSQIPPSSLRKAGDPILRGVMMSTGGSRTFDRADIRRSIRPCYLAYREDDDFITAIAKRSVFRRSTCRRLQACYHEARVPQSPCSLISNLLSRVQSSWCRPVQRPSLNFSVRFSASTASAN